METFIPPRVSLDWTDGAYLLRPFEDRDATHYRSNKIYPTWIMFTKADDYIVARIKSPLGEAMFMGIYKDQTFEWSDELLHNVEVHTDIACKICMWCEQAIDQPTGLWQDESVNHEPGDIAKIVTPGELHNRLADSVYLSAHAALTMVGREAQNRSVEEIAQDITRNVLGTLSGRSRTLPAFKLVVDQSPANVQIREMAMGDRFTNGDELKPNSTTMVHRARQLGNEIAADIQKTIDELSRV